MQQHSHATNQPKLPILGPPKLVISPSLTKLWPLIPRKHREVSICHPIEGTNSDLKVNRHIVYWQVNVRHAARDIVSKAF